MTVQPILIDGRWRQARAAATFRAENPATREPLPDEYPISTWDDCDEALAAADRAFAVLRTLPGERLAEFLEDLCRSHRDPARRLGGDGARRDWFASFAASGRQGVAADDEPVAASGGGRP